MRNKDPPYRIFSSPNGRFFPRPRVASFHILDDLMGKFFFLLRWFFVIFFWDSLGDGGFPLLLVFAPISTKDFLCFFKINFLKRGHLRSVKRFGLPRTVRVYSFLIEA